MFLEENIGNYIFNSILKFELEDFLFIIQDCVYRRMLIIK